MFSFSKRKQETTFGPPYAVLNVSKIGLRYFRICIQCSSASRERLVQKFADHPNVGWIFEADGWFNFAIGIWGKDNAEINDIGTAVRSILGKGDTIVYQSELTSLYGFGDRPIGAPYKPMPIVDAVYSPVDLSPLELDYIKILTLDSSMPLEEMAEILGVTVVEVENLHQKLTMSGVIVGQQERIHYNGIHFKIFIDTLSRRHLDSVDVLTKKLWEDSRCIYVERANGKYDLEFELILPRKRDLKPFLADFSEHKVVILTKNRYTNLYPLNKTANLKEIRNQLAEQQGDVIDFRNSKLWYLNYEAANAYLNINTDKKYAEVVGQAELGLFDEIASYLKKEHPDAAFSCIDVGSGDGHKARVFMEKLGQLAKAYYPVDIQPVELAAAIRSHREGSYAKHPTLLDFANLSARFPLKLAPDERQIYLFLGGTYGNFPHDQINGYLAPLIGPSSILAVAMPIADNIKSDEDLIAAYTNAQTEGLAFGPLVQLGFKKEDFEFNPKWPTLHVRAILEDRRVVTCLTLASDALVGGRLFKKGTTFKLTTSWKPTLSEFREALERKFKVEKIFSNDGMAISLIRQVKNLDT